MFVRRLGSGAAVCGEKNARIAMLSAIGAFARFAS
jgi:hypothetical protein